jgi:hypothetical protein
MDDVERNAIADVPIPGRQRQVPVDSVPRSSWTKPVKTVEPQNRLASQAQRRVLKPSLPTEESVNRDPRVECAQKGGSDSASQKSPWNLKTMILLVFRPGTLLSGYQDASLLWASGQAWEGSGRACDVARIEVGQ